jgi:imidazolonepropionase-like amidohydrolase
MVVTALVDVSVVPVGQDTLLEHQTLLLEGGIIRQLGPKDAVAVPAGAFVVPVSGKYVMPGMADMHVHLPGGAESGDLRHVLDLSLAHGVTVIRGMQGAPEQLDARAHLVADHEAVPTLFLAGPPLTKSVTPDEARDMVRAQKTAGYDFIKLIGGFDLAAYDAVVTTAKDAGIPVCGHVPASVGIDAALAARQSSIEHVMGYGRAVKDGAETLDALAQRTREANVSNCPTLRYYAMSNERDVGQLLRDDGLRYVPKETVDGWVKEKEQGQPGGGEDAMRTPRQIVLALAHAHARILVGSDSPGTFSVPGFAYVDELRQLAKAGLTPYEILRSATLSAAEYLGKEHELGTVATGMRADLVVLDADPRASVENLAHPTGVVLAGAWLPRDALEKRLELRQ